jgi:competence protein ComEC
LAIGVSGFAILMQNPKWLIQPAFALSFMAVLSLGILTGPFEQVFKLIPGFKKLPYWLQQFISAQGSIQFGMMVPLSAYYFCRMSLAGPFANFFAIPLIGVIVQLGLFASILGLIPGVGLYIALVLNAANYIIIWFFLFVAHFSTVIFPFPYVQTMTPRMMAAYYFLLALFVWNKPLIRQAKILYYDLSMGIGGAKRRTEAIAKIGGFFLLVSGVAILGFWPRVPSGDLHVNILSVRYGQAIHIETPSGANILIDGGPNDHIGGWNTGERVVSQYLLKQRIGSLDAIIMTTTSPEEIGGIGAILKTFPTRRFYSTISPWRWDPENPEEFRAEASKAVGNAAAESPRNPDFDAVVFHLTEISRRLRQPWGLWRMVEVVATSPLSLVTSFGPPQTIQVEAGMVLWKETGPGGDLEIVALHPNPEFPLVPTNNNSLVLRVTYGRRSFLIAGDITEDGIREVMRISPEMLRSDLLVVPAHGSSKSDIEQFYNTVLPPGDGDRYAVICWGRDRALRPKTRGRESYRDSFLSHRQLFQKDVEGGVDNTARRLKEMGIQVARTDVNGAILCRTDGNQLDVRAVLGGLKSGGADVVEETERHREFQ